MRHRLPSLQSLLVLDAAVRYGNFSRAAEELSLTHGAVSQQIRALQERVGARLFVREGQSMRPTGACLALVSQVRQAVSVLDRAFDAPHRRKRGGRLVIGVFPHFATGWLISRLPKFSAINEDVTVDLVGSHVLDDLGQAGIDAAIRFGPGQWSGLIAERLIGERSYPVCGPSLYSRAQQGLEHLDARMFLRSPFPPWEPWLQVAGLTLSSEPSGPHFSDPSLMLSAAVMGQGIAMARSIIVADEVRQGRLVRLSQISVSETYAYYLVWRPDGARRQLVKRFLVWIRQELERTWAMPDPPN